MKWSADAETKKAVLVCAGIVKRTEISRQFEGRTFNLEKWERRTLNKRWIPGSESLSSPRNIILHFQKERWLEALAMVVSWGTMARCSASIYGDRRLPDIRDALKWCWRDIASTASIESSWKLLTGIGTTANQMDWSPVITSKMLHFLCRAAGFERNPPVPIDNAIILKKVWPAFAGMISGQSCPGKWQGRNFEAYNRYMTAIIAWASGKGWTTTDMESTLYDQFRLA